MLSNFCECHYFVESKNNYAVLKQLHIVEQAMTCWNIKIICFFSLEIYFWVWKMQLWITRIFLTIDWFFYCLRCSKSSKLKLGKFNVICIEKNIAHNNLHWQWICVIKICKTQDISIFRSAFFFVFRISKDILEDTILMCA